MPPSILTTCPLVAHNLLARQDFQRLAGKAETACPEVHPVVGKAYPVAVTQLVLEEESPYPLVVERACLVEAKVDVQEGSQVGVEDRRSFRKEEVA
jgi:hypothetical protein